MNLTTYENLGYRSDSTVQGDRVRKILYRLRGLGFNHLTFNVRAKMVGGQSNEVTSFVPPGEQHEEEHLLIETIRFAQSLGFSVGLRPILLVVGPRGEFPYVKNGVTWWHGNIDPTNKTAWFQSFRSFHERYLRLSKEVGAKQYTIGAEIHSMSVGHGARRPSHPRGEPALWVQLINYAKSILGPATDVVYDVNYTDQYVLEDKVRKLGGEFEAFRYEMTRDYKTPKDVRFQKDLIEFWTALDVIGLDMYRSLASSRYMAVSSLEELAAKLKVRADSHATQIDTGLLDIEVATGISKPVELKEIGYRSVVGSFLNPASYESSGGTLSTLHQAASWKAIFDAFLMARWPWLAGIHAWEVNVDRDNNSAIEIGFTPLGKPESEQVFSDYFLD